MSRRSRSSAPPLADAELRLPRPPGVIRQFWARHPVVSDVLIALLVLALSLPVAASFNGATRPAGSPNGGGAWSSTEDGIRFASGIVVPAVIIGCALLLRRRQWPIFVFAASAAAAAAYLLAPLAVGTPLLAVTAYSVAVYRSSAACWRALGIALGGIGVLAIVLGTTGIATQQTVWNTIIGSAIVGLIGALVGVNIGNRRRYVDAIIDRSRQLLVERDQQAQLAAAAERTRIAREMHDIVAHSLTVIVALSEGALATTDDARARAATEQSAATARAALAEMRAMLGVLRDPDGADAPLAPSIEATAHDAVAAAQRAGFPVTLTIAGDDAGLPSAQRFALARVVQESLTNAMRHAPRASRIDVRIGYRPDSATVEVVNDGVEGAEPAVGGFGLRGLRERLDHVGGALRAGPADGGLWRVRATMPFVREAIA